MTRASNRAILGAVLVSVGAFIATRVYLRAQGTADDPAIVVQTQKTQSASLAATWLASSDPRTRAWGAYLVLRDHHRELLPQLAALAAVHVVKPGMPTGADRDAHDAMLAVLDALIQLREIAGVNGPSPATITGLFQEFPAQSVILLSRAGPSAAQADAFLFDILRHGHPPIGAQE
jgi:hypothetical protein